MLHGGTDWRGQGHPYPIKGWLEKEYLRKEETDKIGRKPGIIL